MDDDPFPGSGLRPVVLADRAAFNPFFASLAQPLSDYTFSQIYTWRNSLRILWTVLDEHLCVFANGTGDLTLLMPPIGDTGADRALRHAFDLMDQYNATHGVPDRSRVEYASEELLGRFDRAKLNAAPMGTDYVYDVKRMIDLAGGDLASKRQAKNRFLRLYEHRVEIYNPQIHLNDCVELLSQWRVHQDAQHLEEPNANAIKRQKETIATELALRSADDLGLAGIVVYVNEGSGLGVQGSVEKGTHSLPTLTSSSLIPEPRPLNPRWSLRGFTFGEQLGCDQSSIVIEKTDLDTKGLAQFIFSEFCRSHWADRPFTNVGDDWGLESLGWTKMSYRPVKLLQKYTLRQKAALALRVGEPGGELSSSIAGAIPTQAVVRPAVKDDLTATVELESACFSSDLSLKKRQLQYLQQRQSAVFLVADDGGKVIGEGIALVRQHKKAMSGRIYSLAVDNACRGRQVGRRLLQEMVSRLASRGVRRVYLEVEQANVAAIALYERNGFRKIGVLPDYYGPDRPGLHMMRDVDESPTLFDAVAKVA